MARPRRIILASLWVAPFLVAAAAWWWYTTHGVGGNLLGMGRASRLIALGSLAGLFTATAALLQLLLIGRAKWLERAFGQDRLTAAHRYNGILTATLLPVHVILVTLGHGAKELPAVGLFAQLKTFLTSWDDLPAATAAAVLLIGVGLASQSPVRRRLKYELWYYGHLAVYVAIALAFAHQFTYGTGLTSDAPNRAFTIYWYSLYAFCFGNLLLYRLVLPLWRYRRHRFAVTRVVPETDDAASVYIGGRGLERLPARAGQFVFARFLAPGYWWEKHPFSLSRRPDGAALRLTIKGVGDFTSRIPALRPGTRVLIDGPHGVFISRAARGRKLLLLAGGIGITPLRALAEELAPAGADMVLLCGNTHEGAIVFRQELADLQAQFPNLKVTHVLSRQEDWQGERGHVDEEKLRRLVPDVAEREAFLCGPLPMTRSLRKALRSLGVPRPSIHYERFAI